MGAVTAEREREITGGTHGKMRQGEGGGRIDVMSTFKGRLMWKERKTRGETIYG
jgi:hypothetical protein